MEVINNPIMLMSDSDYETIVDFCGLLMTDLTISDADLRQLIEGIAEGDKSIDLDDEEITVTIKTDLDN